MDSKKKGRSYQKWTDQMDKAMLDVFVDHYNKGDRAQNGWKPHVYTAAVMNMREKCQTEVTKEHIISRSKTFDKHYVVVNKMLCQSGFGWDCENNRISVDSDDVWDNYVKVNLLSLTQPCVEIYVFRLLNNLFAVSPSFSSVCLCKEA
jgi:hypothetical protein